jgi:hypothetical protein
MNRRLGYAVALGLALLATGISPATAEVRVFFRSDCPFDDSQKVQSASYLERRIRNALFYLSANTDCGLDADRHPIQVTVCYLRDEQGFILPASYTFPDNMIRLTPEYAWPADINMVLGILQERIRLDAPVETILGKCNEDQKREIESIVECFIQSETIHELYHVWQGRIAKFPVVESAREALTHADDRAAENWRLFLEDRGIDMEMHDGQLNEAERQACSVQRRYWISQFGPHPEHPLEAAFLRLMDDSMRYYEDLASR